MNIETFTVDALQKHQMWYALGENYRTELTLCRPTAAGFDPYNKATAYRMFNGRVVIGFDNALDAQSQNGIVAIGDGITEYISTQPFERIKHLCEIAPPNDNLGTFTFVDSQPVIEENLDWRCDSGRYGPSPYPDLNGDYANPVETNSVLLEYEPIFSVPGIAHLIYLRRNNFETERNQFLNNAVTQMATATFPEMFVLLNEWAQVSEPPFNNGELISQDAKDFLAAIKFNPALIDGLPPMQISKFICGDNNARQRPAEPQPMSQQLLWFLKSKVSHLSLAGLLSTDLGLWDVRDIAELEQEHIHRGMLSLHKQFFVNDAPNDFSLEMFENTYALTIPAGQANYIRSWIKAYVLANTIRASLV